MLRCVYGILPTVRKLMKRGASTDIRNKDVDAAMLPVDKHVLDETMNMI